MGLLVEQTVSKQETVQVEDFSLVLGGPLYQLLVRYKIITPPVGYVGGELG